MTDLLSEIWAPWLAFSLATAYMSYKTILSHCLLEIPDDSFSHSLIKAAWFIAVTIMAPLFVLPTFFDRYRLVFIEAFTDAFITDAD